MGDALRLIDSHAHLGEEVFDPDRREALERAADAGVETVVVIGYDAASSRRAIEVVQEWQPGLLPRLWATAGIAPHHVDEADEAALESIRASLQKDAVVAVGEIGLDYHYDMPRDLQRTLFGQQLKLALELNRPVVVHSREAEDDVLAMLRDYVGGRTGRSGSRRPTGVLHCFTESSRMAEQLVELGFYVSFAGIVTFKKANELRETACRVPLERTLVETDSPYLAPVPHRGRRNEPAWVADVARAIADIHGCPVEEVAAITAQNARDLFGLA